MAPVVATGRRTVAFARSLAEYGDTVALVAGDTTLSYAGLARRVHDLATRLGPARRLVLLHGRNDIDTVVGYLAALAAGHPLLLVPGDNPAAAARLAATYDPDVVLDGDRLDERRPGTRHDPHPDLALLLSTSGSTGSPKLVRLSHDNVQSNAAAIAGYLGIRATDRAVTTLPLHYCYGLSVLNSHLLRGASVVLTELSVVDACFWRLAREQRVTTFAGVPYTFDLLDRVGFDAMDLPSLRYVTQAGGRLAPDRVRRYAALGRQRGWDFYVMYGQTEATARMAYLPPDLALDHPGAIGVPIPGGSFTLEPAPEAGDPDTGELVYDGPNVMLGYAESPADLALGRTVERLRTGDLARRTPEGLYEITGRRGRFAKVYGLRIDLAYAEQSLAADGIDAACASDDHRVVVAVDGATGDDVKRRVTNALHLPPSAVTLVSPVPRLANGKPDYAAIERVSADTTEPAAATAATSNDVRALFAEVLERPDASDADTFVSLGGDSLSYVEMSVRLEAALGDLPAGWHVTPIGTLAAARAGAASSATTTRRTARVETSVVLRAIAVLLIVGSHSALFRLPGTAHVLLAVAGFNFARFQLTPATRRERLAGQARSIARIALPSMAWIAGVTLLAGKYGLANVFLLNAITGSETWTGHWHFWFVEVLVYVLVVLAALLAIPRVDRAERRQPFWFVAAILPVALLGRYEVLDFGVVHPKPVFWLFALGWATARATTTAQRLAISATAAVACIGFFADPARDALIAAGVLALVWLPSVRVPAFLTRALSVLASASLYIYLVQWQVYPPLMDDSALLAVVASVAAGVAYWLAVTRVTALAGAALGMLRR